MTFSCRKGDPALKKIAVLGAGNIAQTIAVDLKASGHEMWLFAPENLIHRFRDFADTQVIGYVGALETWERIDIITSDIDQAVDQTDYIIVCVTGSHHQEYAQMLEGHTSAEQIMATFNGCTASLIYKNMRGDNPACPVFVESTIPPFSTGLAGPSKVRMFERHLTPIAFFPASAADHYSNQIKTDLYDFPGFYIGMLERGLSLINPTAHPGPYPVSLSSIEELDFTFFLYEHGFQPSGLKIDVLLNRERLVIDKALDYQIHVLEDFAGVEKINNWEPPYAIGHGCRALTSITGPNDINYRYLTKDIPVTLVYWASIGDLAGVDTPIMDAVITLVGVTHDADQFVNGRSTEKLGLTGKSVEQIQRYVKTGEI